VKSQKSSAALAAIRHNVAIIEAFVPIG